jgi:exosortase/archaeosortase family protein
MSARKQLFSFEEASYFMKVIFVYGSWKAIHAYLWRTPESMYAWQNKLEGYGSLYASLTCSILRIFGYPSFADGTTINITPEHNTWVAEHCLAIPAMFVFGFSILLFKGSIKDKAWFIPLGILVIFLLNLFRLVSLSILMTQLSEITYQVYHRYVFLVVTYGAILLMVVWWMDRVMKEPIDDHQKS